MKTTSISHDEALIKELRRDSVFAAEYLKAAFEDSNPDVLLIALRQVAEAKGGMAKVAARAGLQRESLYRSLSPKGNPTLSTLLAVMKAVGLKFSVLPRRQQA